MTETDTEFLARMQSQSSVPQGQAAHPDMTRLLALAARGVAEEYYSTDPRAGAVCLIHDCAVSAALQTERILLKNEIERLAAEAVRLREALDLYREAVRIDVTMEGPKFAGSNASALKRAWDFDCTALKKESTP